MAASRQRALTALGAVISVAALAGVVFWALHQDAPTWPDTPSKLALLGAAIVVYLGGCAARGERWLALLHHNGAQPSRLDAYGLVAVGYLGNNVLPARAGDALRVVLLAPRARTDARTVIGTIVAERVLDVVLLVGLFVVLAYGVLGGIDVPSAGRLLFAALIVAGLLALLAGGRVAAAPPRAPAPGARLPRADGRRDGAHARAPRRRAAGVVGARVGAGVGRLVADGRGGRAEPRAARRRLPHGPRDGLRARAERPGLRRHVRRGADLRPARARALGRRDAVVPAAAALRHRGADHGCSGCSPWRRASAGSRGCARRCARR